MRDATDIRAHPAFGVGGWLVLAAASLTLVFGVGSAQAAFPGENGRIAFAVEK